MKQRVQLLNVSVDIASTEEASTATIEYLQELDSKVVYFLNSETLLSLRTDEQLRSTVENSEFVLPGSASVNKSINDVLGHKRDSFFSESYFDNLFDYAEKMGYVILVATDNQEKYESIRQNIHSKREYISLDGVYFTEQNKSLAYLVNEINAVAPDILLVALEESKQLDLLQDYRRQMNAQMLIFTGSIFYDKAVDEAEVPAGIRKLKISHLYKWYCKQGRIRSFLSNIMMKMQIKKEQNEQDL